MNITLPAGPAGTLGEFELIDRFFARPARAADVSLGVGDDAALIAPTPGCELAFSTDMLVAGRHFHIDVDVARLGHKTLAVNLSDMAAMGAKPRFALLACALPDNDPAWLADFARGFFALADRYDVELIGGDTTRGPLNLCVTVIGEVPRSQALTRAGAQPGDDIYVSGEIGGAALALAAIAGRTGVPDAAFAAARRRLELPVPRIELGVALRGLATAALDISDGLTGDLGHIIERSGSGASIDLDRLPAAPHLVTMLKGNERELALECMLAGGDDYELCFTASNAHRVRVDALARALDLPLSRIGKMTPGAGLVVRDESGAELPSLPRAFDHFAQAR